MKKLLFLLAAVVLWFGAIAQPKQTLVTVPVAPEHADWQYRCGEEATFNISVCKANVPLRNAEVYYELSEDMQKPLRKATVTLKDGTLKLNVGTMRKAGFLRLRVWATVDGTKYEGCATAGFDIDKIEPTTTQPDDFDTFWQRAIAENNKLELRPVLKLVPDKCTDRVTVYSASFQNLRKGARIYGTLCVPKVIDGRCPAILIVPGAGCRSRKGFYEEAEKGFVTFEVGIHGIPTVMDDSIYNDLKAGVLNSYQFYNLDDRDNYIYKGIYLGCARAVDFLASLDFVDPDRIGVTGGSQGGALSITTAVLNPRVKCLAAFYPALCDLTGYLYGRGGGWPHLFKDGKMATAERIATSRYYDVVNFSRKVTVPTYFSYGFNDMTCCPTSTTTAYNVITAPKERWIVPDIKHYTYPEQWKARSEWIMHQLSK